MAWKWWENVVNKMNPAQEIIASNEGSNIGTTQVVNYLNSYIKVEPVNRGCNMISSAAASLDYDIKDKVIESPTFPGIRQKTLNTLLNYRPNPHQPIQEFRSALFLDFLLEGNAFIYFDGAHMYHLPARDVEILTDPKTYISGYRYGGHTTFKPNEVFYFKDGSVTSIYRGTSRLSAADGSIRTLSEMLEFQSTFFKNGAVPGFALSTENTLSQSAKQRTINNWVATYNVKNSARRPIIIDSGLKPVQLFTNSFKELDFDVSIKGHAVKILEVLGVPPVLLDGGNQANISPNLRLFYLETVLPIVRKYTSALELMFGYDIEAVTSNVSALQPELKDVAAYYTSLVNGGILTSNEARKELRYEADKDPESDTLRIPANIAGSASDPSTGGRPKTPKEGSKN